MTFDDLPGMMKLVDYFNEGVKALEALNWLKDSDMVSITVRKVTQGQDENAPEVTMPAFVAFNNLRNMVQYMSGELERLGVKPPPVPVRVQAE